MDSSRTTMSPPWMRSSAFTHRINVLLPEPDGPHTTTTSPGATPSVTSLRTWSLPNHLSDVTLGVAPGEDVAQDVELAEPLVDLPELDRRRHQAAVSSPKSSEAMRAGSRTSSASFDSERSTAVAMASGPPTAASVSGGSPAKWTVMSP